MEAGATVFLHPERCHEMDGGRIAGGRGTASRHMQDIGDGIEGRLKLGRL